ncbi:copper resistance protein CopC [Trinickia violacea]|uniref:Copper resistance protein CopC n=1 Tax=Trinickia violacea TaxID=2571746 RepID=A0A4P8IXT0_9BURK|nr:copper resistance protein CopC [Trinickia violacea]QCP51984.1 copper resistance protein CopC [Trinickia violacea]
MKLHTNARGTVAALLIAGCQLAHAHAYPTHQAPGVYTISWVAVAADGHRTQGHYSFTVK